MTSEQAKAREISRTSASGDEKVTY